MSKRTIVPFFLKNSVFETASQVSRRACTTDSLPSASQGWDHSQHILATAALFCDLLFRFCASCLWSRCFLGWSLLTLEGSYAFWPVGFWGHNYLACSDCLFFFYDRFLASAVTKANHSLRNRCIVGEVFRTAVFFSIDLFIY